MKGLGTSTIRVRIIRIDSSNFQKMSVYLSVYDSPCVLKLLSLLKYIH
jgi:hypothetical protein